MRQRGVGIIIEKAHVQFDEASLDVIGATIAGPDAGMVAAAALALANRDRLLGVAHISLGGVAHLRLEPGRRLRCRRRHHDADRGCGLKPAVVRQHK